MSEMKRAILIAAGEGRRLRPVTLETPKPLVKVNGKRIIDTGIDALRSNGIRDIYIVVGYKKEMFYDLYAGQPDIHLIENPDYDRGNNITSLYAARQYLPEAFVLEADSMIQDPAILSREASGSGYMASWKTPAREWILDVKDGRILDCQITGQRDGYQLFGVSWWDRDDGVRLAEDIRRAVEERGDLGLYWDQVALGQLRDKYYLQIKQIGPEAVCEIDTLDELIRLDASYERYKR